MTVSSDPWYLPPFPPPSCLFICCPTFLTTSFISFARTRNFLQWGKISSILHLPPSTVTVLCVWGLTLLHPYISLLSVSSWNSVDSSNWMNLPGFLSHSCGISTWDQHPASCRSLAHEGSTIGHALPVADYKDTSWEPSPACGQVHKFLLFA